MAQRPYQTLGKEGHGTIRVLGSTFISCALPISSEPEALDSLSLMRTRYPDASHHAFAYRIGLAGDVMKWSDDGEPHGSAGGPLKTLLVQREITDAVVIVSRTFGGTELGKGRLTRTYAAAGKYAVEDAGIVRMVPCSVMQVEAPYEHAARLEHDLRSNAYDIVDVAYGACVTITLHCTPGMEGGIQSVCAHDADTEVRQQGTTMRPER
jgi:putative IMPACT (imprinted ancient) family translation regulator